MIVRICIFRHHWSSILTEDDTEQRDVPNCKSVDNGMLGKILLIHITVPHSQLAVYTCLELVIIMQGPWKEG